MVALFARGISHGCDVGRVVDGGAPRDAEGESPSEVAASGRQLLVKNCASTGVGTAGRAATFIQPLTKKIDGCSTSVKLPMKTSAEDDTAKKREEVLPKNGK